MNLESHVTVLTLALLTLDVCLAIIVIIFLTSHLKIKWLNKAKWAKRCPPGPEGWSVSGQILKSFNAFTFHELACEWAKIYGRVTFARMFGKPILVINDAHTAKELLNGQRFKHSLAHKQPGFPGTHMVPHSMFFSVYDDVYKRKRCMLVHALSADSTGAPAFEDVFRKDLSGFLKSWEAHQGDAISPHLDFRRFLTLTLARLVLGQGQEVDENDLEAMYRFQEDFTALIEPGMQSTLAVFPGLRNFPYTKFRKAHLAFVSSRERVEDIFVGRTTKGTPGGILGDILASNSKSSQEAEHLSRQHVCSIVHTTFLGGFITMHSTVMWGLLVLLNKPDIMAAIQHEIDQKVGARAVDASDLTSLPYVHAVVLEVLRYCTPVPLNCYRWAREDVAWGEHVIPRGTTVFLNNWLIHHNEDFWTDPWAFRPGRFLDDQGDLLPANHPIRSQLLSWGAGLRTCPGEAFSISRVGLILASVLQKFDLTPVHDTSDFPTDDPIMSAILGVARTPLPYCLSVKLRQQRPSLSCNTHIGNSNTPSACHQLDYMLMNIHVDLD